MVVRRRYSAISFSNSLFVGTRRYPVPEDLPLAGLPRERRKPVDDCRVEVLLRFPVEADPLS